MYTCITIDDDFSSLDLLSEYIATQPKLKLLKTYNNPKIALNEILNLTKAVDLIFLDIEMPEINGIELAQLIKHKAKKLIFATAHTQYAINAFDIEIDGFLLKPIPLRKFQNAINSLLLKIETNDKKDFNDFILVKSTIKRNQQVKIVTVQIIAIEAQERTTKIITRDEIIISNSNVTEIVKLLHFSKEFIQIHRSFIIAKKQIKIIERSNIILKNNSKVPIGRKYIKFIENNLKIN